MNSLTRKVIGESAETETRTYTVTSRAEFLDQIERLFSWINSTNTGHSGSVELSIDGDGAARVTVDKKDGKLPKLDDAEIHTAQSPEFKVNLE